jgi:UDPglucose 6-dehydrogenase
MQSNRVHQGWVLERVDELLKGVDAPTAAVLGLTYKAGTNTLRRSPGLDLARSLVARGCAVRACDPSVERLPPVAPAITLTSTPDEALKGADVAILVTAWPSFEQLTAAHFVELMNSPNVIDQAGLFPRLAEHPGLTYVRVGRPAKHLEAPE